MFAVKLLANYLFNVPSISQHSLKGIVFIISGSKLLAIFQRVFKEAIKIVHLKELANQARSNGALVIKKSAIRLVKGTKTLVM